MAYYDAKGSGELYFSDIIGQPKHSSGQFTLDLIWSIK